MMIVNTTLVIVVVGLSMLIVQAYAWLLPSITRGDTKRSFLLRITDSTENDWSATDNWNRLSKDNQEINTNHLLIADQITLAALRMQNFGMNPAAPELSKEDQWLRHVIEHIVTDDEEEVDTKPSSVDKHTTRTETFSDDMGREIALLVRCNQNPHDLLMEGGRMVEELTDQQRNDVRQLVQYDGTSGAWQATPFLREAASSMFQTHVSNNKPDRQGINGDSRTLAATKSALDAVSVASWMSKSLRETVGPHDKRVTQAVARFGSGGYLVEADLLNLYVTSITGEQPQWSTITQLEHHRTPEIMAVWRDIRNHGLVTPAEFEQSIKVAELQAKYGVLGVEDTYSPMNMLDECEILEDHMVSDVSMTTDRHGKSSHERVDLVRGIPIWMKDVFIDEQSCIGCMQCATVAPSSFQMLDHDGRARTFFQRKSPDVKTAVASCPVDCMHFVSFEELKELELARDVGVGDDHRHFGHTAERGYIAPTPLHVSRRDSDANHRSSFYHFLRNKCFKSTQCPQRGCYDCSRYRSEPGGNPYFKKRLAKATHIRAEFFKKTGIADTFRKTADL